MVDRLRNVKEFYVTNVIDGFGVAKYIGHDYYPDDLKFLHNKVLPRLYEAIKADDPGYDAHEDYLRGEFTSEAQSTAAVRWFVELMEAHAAFQELIDPRGQLYDRMYHDTPPTGGCFLGGLRRALQADDPDWRGPRAGS